MPDTAFKSIFILTGGVVLAAITFIFLIRLEHTISTTESELNEQIVKSATLNKVLDSLTATIDLSRSHAKIAPVEESVPKKISQDTPQDKLAIKPKSTDTTNQSSSKPQEPKRGSSKITFIYSGVYSTPIELNKLFSLQKIDLTLTLALYDSMYQYTPLLGLTQWKLVFTQKEKVGNREIISVFRIESAEVEDNKTVVCRFVEELTDFTFSKTARVANFRGNIVDSQINGELKWIDRTYNNIQPLNIQLTLLRN